MDDLLTMETHVQHVCRTSYFQLYNISNIHHLLNPCSRNISTWQRKLLILWNCWASTTQITKSSKFGSKTHNAKKKNDHITPVLSELHWLPIKQRIDFKMLLLTHRVINGLSPTYLCDILDSYHPVRPLRSSDGQLLNIPRTRLCKYGDRAFAYVAPRVWNNLPFDIRNIENERSF